MLCYYHVEREYADEMTLKKAMEGGKSIKSNRNMQILIQTLRICKPMKKAMEGAERVIDYR